MHVKAMCTEKSMCTEKIATCHSEGLLSGPRNLLLEKQVTIQRYAQ